MRPLRIAITTGEPAGIGPEITAAALRALLGASEADVEFIVLGDADLLAARGGLPRDARVRVDAVPLAVPVTAGVLDVRNAPYVLTLLDRALAGCVSGAFDAMVTAPLQKSVIADAGVPFSGHTEYLAQHTGTARVVMMLTGDTPHGVLRVALATTHLPLAAVPAALTHEGLVATLAVLAHDLRTRFGLPAPRIAVTGLNPHAGEAGHLGREEIEVIAPALATARAQGLDVHGPLPADTLFVPAQLARYDAVLAMYHDQGLAPLKYATFGHGVNVTLGLPFVRTSVDHGTALDRAGRGDADAGSMRVALDLALRLAARARGGA
jgi:4-hydroxythreonine-4-phosphate dehydrogenase